MGIKWMHIINAMCNRWSKLVAQIWWERKLQKAKLRMSFMCRPMRMPLSISDHVFHGFVANIQSHTYCCCYETRRHKTKKFNVKPNNKYWRLKWKIRARIPFNWSLLEKFSGWLSLHTCRRICLDMGLIWWQRQHFPAVTHRQRLHKSVCDWQT